MFVDISAKITTARQEKRMDFDLERFVKAQNGRYGAILAELRSGEKITHWMWFIFPQITGLGHSEAARYFAISGLEEAQAYLHHPVLGEHLRECTQAVLAVEGRSLQEIFGSPDDLKFRSSMTLFEYIAPDEPLFTDALARYCDGKHDERTLEIIQKIIGVIPSN